MNRLLAITLGLATLGISSATYNATDALRSAYMAATAYCSQSAIENWNCGPCKQLPGVTSPTYMMNNSADGFADVYGYVAQLPNNYIVIGFRGTISTDIRDWILDFDFIPIDPNFGECSGCMLHEGFLRGWLSLRSQTLAALQKMNAMQSNGIYVTGHSLGAAMANIATFDLASNGYPIANVLYNYGQPRTGNPAYGHAYETIVTNRSSTIQKQKIGDNANIHSYRVVHYQDPVPQLPPQAFGFQHSPLEVWYNQDQSSYTLCSMNNGEDPTCSDSQIDLNIEDHLSYVNIRISEIC